MEYSTDDFIGTGVLENLVDYIDKKNVPVKEGVVSMLFGVRIKRPLSRVSPTAALSLLPLCPLPPPPLLLLLPLLLATDAAVAAGAAGFWRCCCRCFFFIIIFLLLFFNSVLF